MKKTLLIALVLTIASGMAIAQQQGGPGGPGGKGPHGNSQGCDRPDPVERMTETLALDETQAAEIALIFEESQLMREEEQERSRAISEENRANTHAQIMQILNSDQQVLFAEHIQQREQMRQAYEEIRAERGYGRGRGAGDCSN